MTIQKKLTRVRPPRVRILYEVERDGFTEKRELPFVLGVITDLRSNSEYARNRFINVDRNNINQIMAIMAPSLIIAVDNVLSDKKTTLSCELRFLSSDDFAPDGIALQIPECKALIDDRSALVDLVPKIIQNKALSSELANLAKAEKTEAARVNTIANSTGFIIPTDDEASKKHKINLISAFARQVKGTLDLQFMIIKAIANIDEVLSKQITLILHHPDFKALEAKWLSLHNLVNTVETGELIKIKVLTTSSVELYQDLKYASDFDQSHLFRLVYEEEYGTIGGTPFSCIVFDEYFDKTDVDFLKLLSQIMAAAHIPLLTGVKPSMFGLKSFTELHLPRDLYQIFETSDSVEWNAFRDTEESRYINLLLPYVLTRAPYGKTNISKIFQCSEVVNGESVENFAWGNAAYCMAFRILEAAKIYGWAAAIRGTEGGGLVSNLPSYTFQNQFADLALKCPTQTQVTDRREKELSDLGFIALCHKKLTDQAVFFSGQSAQKPKQYHSEDVNTNSHLSSRLPYVLNASRFVHYIKVIMRDKVGSFQNSSDLEYFLQDWIGNYVLLADDGDQKTKAQYPLREARVQVTPIEGSPGEYDIIVRLRPHFQLEAANISVRFVGKILAD